MADVLVAGAADHETASKGVVRTGSVRPPNRKKFEEELDVINTAIQEKEAELKLLPVRPEDKLVADVQVLCADRDTHIQRRKCIDTDLRGVSEEVKKQQAELIRIQSSLTYREEAKINEKISRLNTQLAHCNFRVSEERRIVAEIDALKRSKKELTAFQAVKKQIDEKREQQGKLRAERDRIYHEERKLSERIEKANLDLRASRDRVEIIKRDLAELRRSARARQAEFNAREREYRQQRELAQRRQAVAQQRERVKERKAAEQAYKAETAEYQSTCDAYASERLLCATLAKYLQRYNATPTQTPGTTGGEEEGSIVTGAMGSSGFANVTTPVEQSQDSSASELERSYEAEGLFILRRKVSDDEDQSVNRVKSVRRKKKSFLVTRRTLSHAPETLAQFEKLGLSAPQTTADIATSLLELENKKVYYETLSFSTSSTAATASTAEKPTKGPHPTLVQPSIDLTIPRVMAASEGAAGGAEYEMSLTSTMSWSEGAYSIPTSPEISAPLSSLEGGVECDPGVLIGDEEREGVVGGLVGVTKRKVSRDSGTCEQEDLPSGADSGEADTVDVDMVALLPADEVGCQGGEGTVELKHEGEGRGSVVEGGEEVYGGGEGVNGEEAPPVSDVELTSKRISDDASDIISTAQQPISNGPSVKNTSEPVALFDISKKEEGPQQRLLLTNQLNGICASRESTTTSTTITTINNNNM